MAAAWIDVTLTIRQGMVTWPSDPVYQRELFAGMAGGAPCNASMLHMTAHTGTHMDAPRHFVADGKTIEQVPLDAVMGVVKVIRVHDPVAVTPEELGRHRLERGDRILFRTRNSDTTYGDEPFNRKFVSIRRDAAEMLVRTGVRTVGVDYLSVGAIDGDGVQTHQVLLGAGLWLIEGLYLAEIEEGQYEMACLPLKIEGSDGAPARVLLRRIDESR
ncbi:MAG: cyclase family protein [Phycisphaeraceae bacterium]|nr:cyclase family protein [Phycisphaeraceae bacterium]